MEKNGDADGRREEFTSYLDRWTGRLGLHGWLLEVELMGEDADEGDGNCRAADCSALPAYRQASIRVYPEFFRLDAGTRDLVAAHELSHCVLSPLDSLFARLADGSHVTAKEWEQATEYVATSVARIALKAYGKPEAGNEAREEAARTPQGKVGGVLAQGPRQRILRGRGKRPVRDAPRGKGAVRRGKDARQKGDARAGGLARRRAQARGGRRDGLVRRGT